ncbi:glycosyltransferase family 25 protein [Lentithecium fluviatile CBS 122367]|uniref:Glycosyltransferase family 25 protein n=1 Tax=Lentithecium fluviatile CBS 122367 TaxID=1168545 RepID=A0A6G1IIQ0_9PLEO|nr:glycosyltransferase family 25 protein [Lentithecium fluviatile CBS 122367]
MLARGPLLWVGVLGLIWIVLTFAWMYGSIDRAKEHAQATYAKYAHMDSILDAGNSTLGFERVFVASMPDRTDKRDMMALSASLSDIKFQFEDGIDASKVSNKAIPDSWDRESGNGTYGCWRVHMNIAQKIAAEQISTALVLEDDADWDVHLKSQLTEFARGTRYVLDQESNSTASPYGDGWDILWLGHCGLRNRENIDQRYYVIRDDPTAVPQSLWSFARRMPNLTPKALNGTYNRVIYEPTRGLCTWGYAISLRGARRLLQDQELEEALPSDRALNRLCTRVKGAKCLAPYPPLVGTHKAAGRTGKDSDRVDQSGKVREVGETGQIIFSVKLNLKQLLGVGKDLVVRSQWPDKTMVKALEGEGGRGLLEIPRGEGVWVRKSEYLDFPRPN